MNESTAAASTPRFDGVDLLRGYSILAVVLLHTWLRFYFAGFSIRPQMPPWLFQLVFTNGNNGVTVFFAVSGFLITLTSLRRFGSLAAMRPLAFYRIRFARIAPLLLLLLVVLGWLHLAHVEDFVIRANIATLPRALFAALMFHLNYLEAVRGFLPPCWDVLWSLSVEEMFYLFFPLLCVLVLGRRRGVALFLGLLSIFVMMGPFARTLWTANEIWREKSYLGGMDAIALGCMFALLTDHLVRCGASKTRRQMNRLLMIEIAGAAMILLVVDWPRWMNVVGRTGLDGTMLALGTCLVMIGSVLRGRTGRRWTAPIRWFGRHSYEVYLTHEFVVVGGAAVYIRLQRGPLAIWFAVILLLSAPLGAAVARYFSEPLNRRLRGGRMAAA